MKTFIMMIVTSFVILMGGNLLACGDNTSCSSSDSSSSCNTSTYDAACSCVDPSCGWTWEHNCTSQSTCCEAFGNIAGS